MYLNEKSWNVSQENPYIVDSAMRQFLEIYASMARDFHITEVYVPEDEELYLHSTVYPMEKWLAKADIEYRRLYLTFRQKMITYQPENEVELTYEKNWLKGGTEAFLNDSFMISVLFDEKWKQKTVRASVFSLQDMEETETEIPNVFEKEQLHCSPVVEILKAANTVKIYSYEELWARKEQLFPHLCFCPSVEYDLKRLETFYLPQIIRKLRELDNYCRENTDVIFQPGSLTKTTTESDSTMKKYKKEHTFLDEDGTEYTATWHMRFTGIPGRIFFVPQYRSDCMLICYIGKKLPNVSYPT